MQLSMFYAQLIGSFLVIVSLIWAFRHRQLEPAIRDLFASKGALAVSGCFTLLFGLAIAITHTVWEMDYRGLVTLLGYLYILRGITRLGFPHHAQRCVAKILAHRAWMIGITFVVGAYLAYCGMGY